MENIIIKDNENSVFVNFTPTIPHCSMATLIGLSLRVKLLRSLPRRFKVSIFITPGTHQSELAGIIHNITSICFLLCLIRALYP